MYVKLLTNDMRPMINAMDAASGFYVEQWVDDNTDFAWGIFTEDHELAGYCTTGEADDCTDVITQHKDYRNGALLLSDVYMKPAYRHRGYGRQLIKDAIRKRRMLAKDPALPVHLQAFCPEVEPFYETIGFVHIDDDGCMVLTNPF